MGGLLFINPGGGGGVLEKNVDTDAARGKRARGVCTQDAARVAHTWTRTCGCGLSALCRTNTALCKYVYDRLSYLKCTACECVVIFMFQYRAVWRGLIDGLRRQRMGSRTEIRVKSACRNRVRMQYQ